MAWTANLVVPGTGLIARRREWLGAALALLFGVCGHAAILGTWVAPKQWPAWITTAAWVLAGSVWAAAQGLYLHETRRSDRADGGTNGSNKRSSGD